MSIIRVKKDKNYFAASNKPFNDKRLSWEARGVMGYLLSKPDDWQVRFFDLINQGDAKRFKMRRILKELEDCGYLTRQRIRKDDGTYDWMSTVHETPTHGDTIGQSPTHGVTIGQSPTGGKPTHIISTESINTNKKTNGGKPPRKRDSRLDHPAIIAYREEAHLHVPINIRDDVVAVVTDADKWQKIVHSWIGKGWNKQNIEGMLQVYRDGWRDGKAKTFDTSIFDKIRKERYGENS